MTNYNETLMRMRESLAKSGIGKIIAFSGSVPKGLEAQAEQVVEESFQALSTERIAVQIGGTNFDIQVYAADRARKMGIPVIGVYPARGAKYALKDMDFAIEVEPRYAGSEWGDETEIFAKIPDMVEIVGGGLGTLIEFSHLMKINDGKIGKKQTPVYIAPVVFPETRTAADVAYEFPLKPELRVCIPERRLKTGKEAIQFLLERLSRSQK
jgi:hypothetical protein